MRRLALALALTALAAAPSASRAGIILGANGLINNDSSSFVNPPPNQTRHNAPGSPSSNSLINFPPTIGSTTTLPFNNAYTLSDLSGAAVGSVASSLSASLSYTPVGSNGLRITASLSDTNEGHTLNNSGWRSTNTSQNEIYAVFTLTTPMYYTYHQTSSESATGTYTNVGTSGSFTGSGLGTIASGVSVLNVYGNEGTVPTLDMTSTGLLLAGTYEIVLGGLVNGETIYYGGNHFTTTTTGSITLTLTAVPEPSSLALLSAGAAGLGLSAYRRRACRR
jgi:hypothetical protein